MSVAIAKRLFSVFFTHYLRRQTKFLERSHVAFLCLRDFASNFSELCHGWHTETLVTARRTGGRATPFRIQQTTAFPSICCDSVPPIFIQVYAHVWFAALGSVAYCLTSSRTLVVVDHRISSGVSCICRSPTAQLQCTLLLTFRTKLIMSITQCVWKHYAIL